MSTKTRFSFFLLISLLSFAGQAGDINTIQDGSFELGSPNPFWQEMTTEPTIGPICNTSCEAIPLIILARTGVWYVKLGGLSPGEMSVSQNVFLEADQPLVLQFYVANIRSEPGGQDAFEVTVDDELVYRQLESNAGVNFPYERVVVDLSGFADGMEHTIRFRGTDLTGNPTEFLLDDVSIVVRPSAAAVPVLNKAGFILLLILMGYAAYRYYKPRTQ